MVSQSTIDERKANLPLPSPPAGTTASDLKSATAEYTGSIGSGSQESSISSGAGSLRSPATGDLSSGAVGREAKDGLSGIPNDAVTRDQKDRKGLAKTTGEDYGYPEKNDPSEGIKK